MPYRHAFAHGLKTFDFSPALITELISTTKRLFQQKALLDELEAAQ
jgi:hypothetical protein